MAGLAESTFTTFTCNFDRLDGSTSNGQYDVAYWDCPGNTVWWYEGGLLQLVVVRPGHVWGHLDVQSGPPAEGSGLRVLSANGTCDDPFSLLFSPGTFLDDQQDCYSSTWTGCFEHNADFMPGSSGGPVIDAATHRVFGVATGEQAYYIAADGPGLVDDPCHPWGDEIWDIYWGYNTGNYLGVVANLYVNQPRAGYPQGPFAGLTPWVGAMTGTSASFVCPNDSLAAGIVGTTGADGYVGNFGLVCVPVDAWAWRLDQATVNAAGSIDTQLGPTVNMDWNTYMRERPSTLRPGLGVQAMALCPMGYFLEGIDVTSGTFVHRITSLRCSFPGWGAQVTRPLGSDPQLWIGDRPGGAPQGATCPAGSFLYGMSSRAGWLLDGFQGFCRYPG